MTTKKMLLSIAAAGLTSGLVACDDSTSSTADAVEKTDTEIVSEAAFKETCETLGGTLEAIATCNGHATCAGISWDNSTGKTKEHACEGLNDCGGWNCLVPAEEAA